MVLGGRGEIKPKVTAKVRFCLITSDLTSLVFPRNQPLATREKNWHRFVSVSNYTTLRFEFLIFLVWYLLKSPFLFSNSVGLDCLFRE